jgi:hypothetical protein
VVTLLLTAPVFAADEHEHGTREEAAGEMQPGTMMGMSGNENGQSMNMEERMNMMQNQMGMMGMMMDQMMQHYSQDAGRQ